MVYNRKSGSIWSLKYWNKLQANSKEIGAFFNNSSFIPVKVVFKSVMRSMDEITNICIEANAARQCIGVVTWCHTFSPSKMWINGLKILNKPMLQLHTQYNRDLPWSEIDMDFMNLNQAAHGDREHGVHIKPFGAKTARLL